MGLYKAAAISLPRSAPVGHLAVIETCCAERRNAADTCRPITGAHISIYAWRPKQNARFASRPRMLLFPWHETVTFTQGDLVSLSWDREIYVCGTITFFSCR